MSLLQSISYEEMDLLIAKLGKLTHYTTALFQESVFSLKILQISLHKYAYKYGFLHKIHLLVGDGTFYVETTNAVFLRRTIILIPDKGYLKRQPHCFYL